MKAYKLVVVFFLVLIVLCCIVMHLTSFALLHFAFFQLSCNFMGEIGSCIWKCLFGIVDNNNNNDDNVDNDNCNDYNNNNDNLCMYAYIAGCYPPKDDLMIEYLCVEWMHVWVCNNVFPSSGAGHVVPVLAQLLLPEPFPPHSTVLWESGVCSRFLLGTVSWRHCSHLYQHPAYLGPWEAGSCIQSGVKQVEELFRGFVNP